MTTEQTPADHHFDNWGDTWKSGKKHRYGLVWAVRGLIGTPLGAAAGATAAVSALLRVPQAIVTVWRETYRNPRIGPNLKTATCVATPVGVGVAAAALSVGGVLVGAVRGFWQGPLHGPASALVDSYHGFSFVGEFLRNLWEEDVSPLREGDKVYEIKPLLGVWSGVMGVVSAFALGAAHGGIYLREFPRLVYKVYGKLWGGRSGFVAFFLDVASVTVVPVGLFLGLPAFAVYGAGWGLGRGMRTTYKQGTSKVYGRLHAAYRKSLRDWQKALGKKDVEEFIDEGVEAARVEG